MDKKETKSGVRRLLVTGDNEQLSNFHLLVCNRLNAIERRNQTIFYTCFAGDFDFAIESARAEGVEVEEITFDDDREKHTRVVEGRKKL